jgi:BirA family biotin operon repressor/biotin-[acetyl-CoA-carboxylase] ligase
LDTLFTGRIIHRVEETTSTNEMATNALKASKVIEGTAFIANHQTQGKGQRGRVWQSYPNQNVLVSYVYFPKFLKNDQQFYLIKAVSLAIKDLLDKYLMDKARIKWPNDIYINDLKITGVLIESTMKGSYMGSSVIGIGMNVNQKEFSNQVNATSIVLETGMGCNLDMMFSELSYHLEQRYLMIKKKPQSLDQEYQKALYRLNEKTRFKLADTTVEMTVLGVDELGQLKVSDDEGQIFNYAMHQIKMEI